MTDPHATEPPVSEVLALEPEDLDGHTIEELSDYLDAGRQPYNASIEHSPACRHTLTALQRLDEITATFLADEIAAEPPTEDDWITSLLSSIQLDAHAGRDFPIAESDGVQVIMTEGALKALIRATGDGVPGFLIGRIRFTGDLDTDDLTISIDVNVVHGYAIPAAVDQLRITVIAEIEANTRFTDPVVDITVRDVYVPRTPERDS